MSATLVRFDPQLSAYSMYRTEAGAKYQSQPDFSPVRFQTSGVLKESEGWVPFQSYEKEGFRRPLVPHHVSPPSPKFGFGVIQSLAYMDGANLFTEEDKKEYEAHTHRKAPETLGEGLKQLWAWATAPFRAVWDWVSKPFRGDVENTTVWTGQPQRWTPSTPVRDRLRFDRLA